MSRERPLTGTDAWRLIALALGKILPDELHATREQLRLFLANEDATVSEIIAPFFHGEVASEAAMLALNATPGGRGCHRYDSCKRTDTNELGLCIANRGTVLAEWLFIPLDRGGHTIEQDGTPVTQRDDLNFTGDVTVTDVGGKTVVNIAPTASLRYEPMTDSNLPSPELYFDLNGDVVMGLPTS